MYQGKALFMDSDMYLRADINELFDLCDMDYYPVYCVIINMNQKNYKDGW